MESSSPEPVTERQQAVVRRSPRYGRFMVLGAALFVVVLAIISYSMPQQPNVDRNAVFGLVALFAAAVGAGLGGILAVVLDRVSRRRARPIDFERTVEEPPPVDAVLESEQDEQLPEWKADPSDPER